jgi:Holliday junction resolvasome RuvABC endonuclease subunit
VIGIDPSLTATGVASSFGCSTFTSKAPGKDGTPLHDLMRLREITAQITGYCVEMMADLAVIEAPAYSSNTGKSTDRAGLHWMIRDRLLDVGVPVAIVITSQLKKYATGKGNADKDSVLIAVVQRLPIMVTNNNEADAAVLYAMGMAHLGHPIAVLPAQHRSALDGVKWPVRSAAVEVAT